MNTNIYNAFLQATSTPEPTAIVTISWVKGSTPCKVGARMFVFSDGTTVGSIGGGYGEAKVIHKTLEALSLRRSCKCKVNMSAHSEEEERVMCCGIMEVFIEVLPSGLHPRKNLLSSYLKKVSTGAKPVLATIINTPENETEKLGEKIILEPEGIVEGFLSIPRLELLARVIAKNFWLDNKAKSIRVDLKGQVAHRQSEVDHSEWEILIEPPPLQPELIILGGGHVALALAKLAKALDYRLIVMDDRPAFANQERFPMADRVICADFTHGLSTLKLGPESYVIIVTRGHRYDKQCFQAVISQPIAYLGMVANPGRVRAFLEDLDTEESIPYSLEKLHAPVGLDLGAETPEEIAVSILAEITQVRRGASGLSLSEKRNRVPSLEGKVYKVNV